MPPGVSTGIPIMPVVELTTIASSGSGEACGTIINWSFWIDRSQPLECASVRRTSRALLNHDTARGYFWRVEETLRDIAVLNTVWLHRLEGSFVMVERRRALPQRAADETVQPLSDAVCARFAASDARWPSACN